MKIVDIYPGMILPKNPQDEIDEQQFLKDNPVWISDIHYKAWQERLEQLPPEDRKRWLEGEWKPASPEDHDYYCNLLHPLAECKCDCSLSKRLKVEHSVLNVPKIT